MINMSDLVEDEKKKNTKICSTDTNEWKNYTHTLHTANFMPKKTKTLFF